MRTQGWMGGGISQQRWRDHAWAVRDLPGRVPDIPASRVMGSLEDARIGDTTALHMD